MPLTTRSASIASLVALTATGLATTATAATPPADAGASYLAVQLASGGHKLTTNYAGQNYPDTGLTADAILALDSTGTAAGEAATAHQLFAGSVKDYVGYGTDVYAGATAKSLITVLAGGQNPKKATGIDLIASLKSLENAQGRFADKSSYGDNSSTLTQSLAIIALKKAGQPLDAKAVTNLLSTQCVDGGFASNLKNGACVSDNDNTALAVQALAAADGHPAQVAKAASYLTAQQRTDGGLIGSAMAPTENANSTGLAAVAFAVSGHPAQAAKARMFVTSLQYGCAFPSTVRGGIAYDAAAYAAMKTSGAKATVSDTDTRATAQGLLALTQKPYVTITAGGTKATPTIECSTAKPKPTSTAPVTPKPTSTHPSTPTPSSTSSTSVSTAPTTAPTSPATTHAPTHAATRSHSGTATGPVVNTDRDGTSSTLPATIALVALIFSGGAVAFARRH